MLPVSAWAMVVSSRQARPSRKRCAKREWVLSMAIFLVVWRVAHNSILPHRNGITRRRGRAAPGQRSRRLRSEEHTSELQSRENLVCRLLLEKKKHDRRQN